MRQKTFPHRNNIDLAISPDGKMLATIVINQRGKAYKDDIYVYDLESRQRVHVFPQAADDVCGYCLLAFSPNSRALLSCKRDGWIDIFSLHSFERLAHFAAHPGLSSHASEPIGGIDWSKTGYIVTGGASIFEKDMKKTGYTIKIWRVEEE